MAKFKVEIENIYEKYETPAYECCQHTAKHYAFVLALHKVITSNTTLNN